MENNFKRKLMAFWLFLLVGIPYMLAQSPMMVSGRITDDLGEPMIGVSVLEKGYFQRSDYEYGGKLFLKGKARRRHCLFVHRICDTGAESRIGENECDDEGRHPDAG